MLKRVPSDCAAKYIHPKCHTLLTAKRSSRLFAPTDPQAALLASGQRIYDLLRSEDEELYIELMCRFEPHQVVAFVMDETHTRYRVDETLAIVVKHRVPGHATQWYNANSRI